MNAIMKEQVMICADKYRIYTLPKSYVLYMNSYGNSNILYCGKDGVCAPFPDELHLLHDDIMMTSEPLGGHMYKCNLYPWEGYTLSWKKRHFLKISSVSKHVPYEIAKISELGC
jgi:hypothetical protein